MTKPEWGTKRICGTCGARFYDLNKDPIICPKCGAENEKDAAPKGKRKGARAEAAPKPSKKVVAPVDDEDEDTLIDREEDEDDADLMEDASDLGEDDDDMAEVIEHIEPGEDED